MNIEDLLEQKALEDLNAAERAFVLEQMSLQEYEDARNAILNSQIFFEMEAAQIQPNPAIPNKALLALKAKKAAQEPKKKGAGIVALFAYKIPAWQAVAALLLVFFFVRGLGTVQQHQTIVVADESLRDTVFIKEYITQIKELPADTVIKVVYQDLKPKKKSAKKILASNKRAANPKTNVNVSPRAVVQEFDDVLQYCNRTSSTPVSKDTFFQLLSNEVLF